MIPVISVVGSGSNLGKTTILCEIIKELKNRGYRVATIKHHHKGDFEIDKPGKDSWKHGQAGADVVVVSSPVKIAKIEKLEEEYSLDEILKTIKNVDIILTEGYKRESKDKIEVLRKGISEKIISKRDELFCIVSDFELEEEVRQFKFNEVGEIVDLIEEEKL